VGIRNEGLNTTFSAIRALLWCKKTQ